MGKKQDILKLFQKCTGKTSIPVPVLKAPSAGYWERKTKEYVI